jgi:hypothetical protein
MVDPKYSADSSQNTRFHIFLKENNRKSMKPGTLK